MVSVQSLGLHRPSALDHLVAESILPPDPDPRLYTWEVFSNDGVEEEIVVTKTCAAWSQGRVVRKLFNVAIELQEIQHTKLAWFPDDLDFSADRLDEFEPAPPSASNASARPASQQNPRSSGAKASTLARALVIFLKQQAHVFFLAGASHVVNLPFQVEKVLDAPRGLVLQRKLTKNNSARLQPINAPSAPQNTFFSSHLRSLTGPKALSSLSVSYVGHQLDFDIFRTEHGPADHELPRHYSFSNPMSELALIVQPSESHFSKSKNPQRLETIDVDEDIIYMSSTDESRLNDDAIVESSHLMVTINHTKNKYSLWHVSYVDAPAVSHFVSGLSTPGGGLASGRRSSFNTTGTATPMLRTRESVRESMGSVRNLAASEDVLSVKPAKKSRVSKGAKASEPSLTADVDHQHDTRNIARESRRVSSMLSRADMNATFDRNTFQDLATQSGIQGSFKQSMRRGQSLGISERQSFGGTASRRLRASTPGTFSELSIDDFETARLRAGTSESRATTNTMENPADHIAFDLTAAAGESRQPNPIHGLKKEVMVRKFAEVPVSDAVSAATISVHGSLMASSFKVFSVTSSANGLLESNLARRYALLLFHKEAKELVQVEIAYKARASHGMHSSHARRTTAIPLLHSSSRIKDVLDVTALTSPLQDRLLLLKQDGSKDSFLYLYSPWSPHPMSRIPIRRLQVSNPHDIQQMRLTPRKHGARRTTSLAAGLAAIRPGGVSGSVDILTRDGKLHQLRLSLWPQSNTLQRLLKLCLFALPLHIGESFLALWWDRKAAYRKLPDGEWHALVVSILALILACEDNRHPKAMSRRHTMESSAAVLVPESTLMQSIQSSWNRCRAAKREAWSWVASGTAKSALPKSHGRESKSTAQRSFSSDLTHSYADVARSFIHSSRVAQVVEHVRKEKAALLGCFASLVTALHCFREEVKLCEVRSRHNGRDTIILAPMIVQLAQWLGWPEWSCRETKYYAFEFTSQLQGMEHGATLDDIASCRPIFESPPSVRAWLELIISRPGTPAFPSLVQLFPTASAMVCTKLAREIFPQTSSLNAYFDEIRSRRCSSAERVRVSLSSDLSSRRLESIDMAFMVTMQEMIAQTQAKPPTTWTSSLLQHVSRQDLIRLTESHKSSNAEPCRPRTLGVNVLHDIHSISQVAEYLEPLLSSPSSDRMGTSRLIFDQDRRLTEALHMIEPYRVAVAQCLPEPGWSDGQILEAQHEVHTWVMTRTFSQAPGLGFAHFDSRVPLLAEKFNIHGYNTLCVMKPMNNTVSIDRSMFTEDKFAWAWFHAGVAAGLSIAKNAEGIDSSWIVFNRPEELNNRHAGLLLALGLNGHLKSMAKWLAFKYLTPKHAMTSVGLLLGLSASYIGTMDTLVTRLLSVHITRMLPPGAAELNLSSLTQTAGMLGVGLLYHNTQHRRMSEIMLSEVENLEHQDGLGPSEMVRDECYRLAAGFAFGLINLGQGTDLRGLHDLRVVERLLTIAVGPRPVSSIHLMDQATAGATMALAFVFMKTNNKAVARKIDFPDTVPQFDFVRPDILLLRTLAKHLIMWSDIRADHGWILKNLPTEYARVSKLGNIEGLKTKHMPFYNIIAGLLWAISLRYAGSGNEQVRDFLVSYLDQFIRICRLPAQRYDSQLTRNTARNCQDLLALACATVMAGTGDLVVFRRLRSLHGRVDADTPYGSHMAGHMAIGALFAGAGCYTFATTNLAVAALVIAFYPIFPMEVNDNKAHLQAFRHLWTLAAEPRCLVVRDIDTQRTINLDVMLHMRDGSSSRITAPKLLPELIHISRITTLSSEYWPVVLDLANNPLHMRALQRHQTIYVRRCPPQEATTSTFTATLMALNAARSHKTDVSDWIFKLPSLCHFETSDTSIFADADERSSSSMLDMSGSAVDVRLALGLIASRSWDRDELWSLRALFKWADKRALDGEKELKYIRKEVLDKFKAVLEKRAREVVRGT